MKKHRCVNTKGIAKAFQVDNNIACKSVQIINETYPRQKNSSSKSENILNTLNELLDCSGVESLLMIKNGEWGDEKVLVDYLNTGDTYNTTIVYDQHLNKFFLTCWGSVMEYYENKGFRASETMDDYIGM